MADGRVTHCLSHGWHVLRYFGYVKYTSAPPIERFVSRLLDDTPAGVVFDLRGAQMLDSTNLGLMVRLAERSGRRCVIVSSNDDIKEVLCSMTFDEMFEIVAEDPTDKSGSETEIAAEPPSREALLRTMLDAHRRLASLEKDEGEFRAVVDQLEAELNAR
jgi:anti-anti-sigma regulatory factor